MKIYIDQVSIFASQMVKAIITQNAGSGLVLGKTYSFKVDFKIYENGEIEFLPIKIASKKWDHTLSCGVNHDL